FGINGWDIDVRRQLAAQLARAELLTHGITVTSAEMRRFYDINIDPKNGNARYFEPETAHIAVIVTPTEQASRRARVDLAQGSRFQTVVRLYSVDPSKASDGVLPWIKHVRIRSSPMSGL